ncbi:MAG: HD domain-containing protein [Verrucomicrobia bacterium]|nr:HD domain-containing protein [Verrucomicrobiota bacterium]
MKRFLTFLSVLCILEIATLAKEFDTFYGPIEIEEPVLIELIESPPFQRLKNIHQYGVAYYTTHKEEYNRYAHSLGVFVILRKNGASLDEQIAGLLHDASHTVFSHVGDWIFSRENQEENYQDLIHKDYLERSGLAAILLKHGYITGELLPKEEFFPALEQKSPNLSADRIDYNIQGAYYQNYITHEEALDILTDLSFQNGSWVATNQELMAKLVRYSLFMNQDCWGSPTNYIASRWLADAILRAVELGCLSMDEIHFSTDEIVWQRLVNCNDSIVQMKMHRLMQADQYYRLVEPDESDILVRSKFRGIDPWILRNGQCVRLTAIDRELFAEYHTAKERMGKGWGIKFKDELLSSP